jgi:hypothetical protein
MTEETQAQKEPKDNQPLFTPMPLISRLQGGIKNAIEESPLRIEHGYTSKNAFWITKEGKIYPYNKFNEIRNPEGVISVHSHLPSNYQKYPDELWDTFNAMDVQSLIWQQRNGAGNAIGVITTPVTFDYLAVTEKTNPQFFRMGIKSLEKELNPTKTAGGYLRDDRQKLRAFAEKYGLEFKENAPMMLEAMPNLIEEIENEGVQKTTERFAGRGRTQNNVYPSASHLLE